MTESIDNAFAQALVRRSVIYAIESGFSRLIKGLLAFVSGSNKGPHHCEP